MVRPCCRKNCGSQVTNPKISVLIVISNQLPTIIRGSSDGVASEARLNFPVGAEGNGNGNGPALADSFSIRCIKASASSERPCASSQRGDSGIALRSYQTM